MKREVEPHDARMTCCSATASSSSREAASTNVSAACRTFGVHRSTYYAWKRQVDRHGLEMLRPRERRRPQMPNQLPKMIEERIVSLLDRPPRARPQARRLRARPGEVGRDRRLAQRRLEGALPPRAEHPRQAPRADRGLRGSLRAAARSRARAPHRRRSGRASWSGSTASTSGACRAPRARSGSSPRSTSPPPTPGPSSSSASRATPPRRRPASSPHASPRS